MGDLRGELSDWLAPFLATLGHKARRRMCPLYVAGLIGPGDRKSVGPMADRMAPGDYDQLYHFVSDGDMGRQAPRARACPPNRRADMQAQARQAPDVWTRKARLASGPRRRPRVIETSSNMRQTPKGTPLLRLAGAVALAPAQLVGVAQPGRARWREEGSVEGQTRFLKRQLSLPVSTMSQ